MVGGTSKVDKSRLLPRVVAAFGITFGAYLVLVILQPIVFEHRFALGSEISGVVVSGKTEADAKTLLEQRWKQYSAVEVSVSGQDKSVSSFVKELKVEETLVEALAREERGYFGLSKYLGMSHNADLTYNDEGMSNTLLERYDALAIAPEDAKITNLENGIIAPEKSGQRLLLPESRVALREGLSRLASTINLRIAPISPMLTANDASALVVSVQQALQRPVSVSGGKEEQIGTENLRKWLKITPVAATTMVELPTLLPREDDGYYYLDQNMVYTYAKDVAAKVNRAAANVVLDNVDGKMVVKSPSVVGQELDTTRLINDIQSAVKDTHAVKLALSAKNPSVSEANMAELGLTEQISRGWTDASGSPVNRQHNYKTGASKFNGVLIKPDEDVSFNSILGPVEASTGYLPELVILADKTVPEYGGGLCQVSSTAFRAALNAGLPILERHNHAYPIVYYKPYGVDATIYLPTPDLRFKNDTGHYILIQTSVVGNMVYFDFYGTKKPGKVSFSGNADATGQVDTVEQVTSSITEQEARGPKSFTATFYRHILDAAGKLTDNDKFTSKYDSPDKYPH